MKTTLITLACLASFTLNGFAETSEATMKNWDRHCKKCHGDEGKGDTAIGKKLEILDYTVAANLADKTDEELFHETKDGIEGSKMKGYAKKLSDEEIHDLVAYIRSMAAN